MLRLINSIWLESGKDLSGDLVRGQLPTFLSLLNVLLQMDENCSQSRLWFQITLGKGRGEKVGLRLGSVLLPGLLLNARHMHHVAPSPPCRGL